MPDFAHDLEDLVALRSQLSQHIEHAENAWFREGKHYDSAAKLLCERLTSIAERRHIWKNITELPADAQKLPTQLGSIIRDLEQVLKKTGTHPRVAAQIVNDVLREIDRLDKPDVNPKDVDLGEMVKRAAEKICENVSSDQGLIRQAFVVARGLVLVSGAVVVVVGFYIGQPALVAVGTGMVTSNVGLIIDGIERYFPPGS